VYPSHLVEYAFRAHASGSGGRLDASRRTRYRKHVCRPCEQTGRDDRKRENRWAVKARDTIRRHAVRLGVNKTELVTRYGWEPGRLAHEAEHAYKNGCTYCGGRYADMGHGLGDITLDVIDRDRAPYYRTNTKWCCQTCNRKKGAMNPDEFEADRQMWMEWNRARELAESDPAAAGRLFN
jgi:hypothetical protein